MDTVKTDENKKVWEKGGPSPNPKGRPKGGVSIVDAIKRKLDQEVPGQDTEERKKYLDKIVDKIFEKAYVDGDVSMLKDMIDRVDGKALQKTDVTTDGKPLVMPSDLYAKHFNTSTEEDSSE